MVENKYNCGAYDSGYCYSLARPLTDEEDNICEDVCCCLENDNETIALNQKFKQKNMFKCKAEEDGYCNKWLRECVSWNNCNLSDYGAPCPSCVSSSPLENENCKECEHLCWKKENYVN